LVSLVGWDQNLLGEEHNSLYDDAHTCLEEVLGIGRSVDVRFLHVIKLFTRKYNRIVSAGSCVFHKHFHNIHHVKCLGINCFFV